MKNEVAELSTDIHIITAEINAYKQVAGEAIFEIGRRLKHVKENDLAHGEFGGFLEGIGMDRSVAAKFVKVYEELSENVSTFTHFGLSALHLIATLPETERTQTHTTEKGDEKTPDEMTVKELRELKRQLKEGQEAKERAEYRADTAERDAEIAKKQAEAGPQEPDVRYETEYVEVEKVPEDYEQLRQENERYKELFGDQTMYSGEVRRVGNDDAITYTVFEFTEDVRSIVQKYGHLTHFTREFKQMISEGKDEYGRAVSELKAFLNQLEVSLETEDIIINQ